MAIAIKVEVYSGEEDKPYETKHYPHFRIMRRIADGYFSKLVEELQEDFKAWVDFPTGDRLGEVFVDNNQKVFEKLYLNSEGNIQTRFVFTVEE